MANPTYLDKYILDGEKANMSLSKFYDTSLVTNRPDPNVTEVTNLFRIPLYDVFIKYRDQLSSAEVDYYIPTTMYYQPKALSQHLYGTTEMWLALLRLNKMRSIIDFKKSNIKVYDPSMLNELLTIFLKREGKS